MAPAFTGSRAVAGEHIDLAALGPDGLSLAERIAAGGGDPDALASAAWDRLAGYVELHIEQGPVLERQGAPIGIVSGISGCQRGWVSFDGEAGHAGTTPMDLRHDALLAAAQTVLLINAIAREGDIEVATAGALQVHPGNANVIARRASVSFDLRSMDDERARSAVERLRAGVVKIAGFHFHVERLFSHQLDECRGHGQDLAPGDRGGRQRPGCGNPRGGQWGRPRRPAVGAPGADWHDLCPQRGWH